MLQKTPGAGSCQETVLEKSEQLPEKKSVVQKPGEAGQQTLCSDSLLPGVDNLAVGCVENEGLCLQICIFCILLF